jgi:hypothetical protein
MTMAILWRSTDDGSLSEYNSIVSWYPTKPQCSIPPYWYSGSAIISEKENIEKKNIDCH